MAGVGRKGILTQRRKDAEARRKEKALGAGQTENVPVVDGYNPTAIGVFTLLPTNQGLRRAKAKGVWMEHPYRRVAQNKRRETSRLVKATTQYWQGYSRCCGRGRPRSDTLRANQGWSAPGSLA